LYLPNNFTNNITECINTEETLFPGDKWIRITGLLFQDNLAIAYFIQLTGYKRKLN